MIRFDKDIDRSNSASYGSSRAVRDKKMKRTSEHHTVINYDFANRDAIEHKAVDNGVLGAVVSEEEKVEKPKNDDRIRMDRKFAKSSNVGEYKNSYDDIEMTK